MKFFRSKKKADPVYPLTWVTPQLAVCHAPMSLAELDSVKSQGIRAIMNLCMEIKDLVELEKEQKFEVYFLPIRDEGFPELAELEKALDWLDECIYLGKKVLIHCRFGIGRTGTVVYSYLLRKGFDVKSASRKMRGIRSQPTEQPQKRFLHKYWKKEKPFQISSKPLPGTQFKVELKPYFDQTKAVFASVEADIAEDTPRCGKDHCRCCFGVVRMSLAEALYLQFRVNTELTSSVRHQVIYRALHPQNADGSGADESQRSCPLLLDNTCILYDFRPVQCRVFDRRHRQIPEIPARELDTLSNELLEIFLEKTTTRLAPELKLPDVVSGKFVQQLFYLMTKKTD